LRVQFLIAYLAVDVLDELCAPDCFAAFDVTIPGFKQYILEFRKAVPDFKLTIEGVIAEGDTVVTRWRWTGTNAGSGDKAILGLMPPVGKPFNISSVTTRRQNERRARPQ
jgi:predicted ester cyclase